MDIHEHYKKMCAGLISEWVSRPKRPVTTVTKTIETIARKNAISRAELTDVAQKRRELSVDTFGPERLARFNQLTDELRRRGVV